MKPTGITFPTALTLLFIYLKLTDQIDWSWWFVLMPFYVGAFLRAIIDQIEKRKIEKLDSDMVKLCRQLGFSEEQIKSILSKLIRHNGTIIHRRRN